MSAVYRSLDGVEIIWSSLPYSMLLVDSFSKHESRSHTVVCRAVQCLLATGYSYSRILVSIHNEGLDSVCSGIQSHNLPTEQYIAELARPRDLDRKWHAPVLVRRTDVCDQNIGVPIQK